MTDSVMRGQVIEIKKITSEFQNLNTGSGAEVRLEGYIQCDQFERWVKFDPRKVAVGDNANVSVGDNVIFELSEHFSNGYPKAYRVRLDNRGTGNG